MKTYTLDDGSGTYITYALKRKNYDDLIITNVLVPRILVLVALPKQLNEWMTLSPEQLVLKRCAHWVSLFGNPESANAATVTVRVPRDNLLTPEALCDMMQKINDKGAL